MSLRHLNDEIKIMQCKIKELTILTKIMIIGGGITGLSTAYYLQKAFSELKMSVEMIVVERDHRFGGKIHTVRQDGFVIEKGPDSFLARKPAMMTLTRELGLEPQLVRTNPLAKQAYIYRQNHLHAFPQGAVYGIPTSIKPFLWTDLISWKGKIRAGLDLLMSSSSMNANEDQALGDFLQQRFGDEVLHYLIEPIVAGIYASDVHQLSLLATFPQFRDSVVRYRSLMRGMKKHNKNLQANAPVLSDHLQGAMFLSYRQGLQTIVEALLDSFTSNHIDLRNLTEVTHIERNGSQLNVTCKHMLSQQSDIEQVDGVIFTVPTHHIANILPIPELKTALKSTSYASVANVALAYFSDEISFPFNGSGFVVPRKENKVLTACTWTSHKWLHTAPKDKILLRGYVGRAGDESWTQWTDEEIIYHVKRELAEIMELHAQPIYTEVTRWIESMPQYAVGHLDRVKLAHRALNRYFPHVWMTGAGFHGVGLPDCIQQAEDTAHQCANAFLQSRQKY
jgi:oxygen-dependent protoporphyrinogen oxidase